MLILFNIKICTCHTNYFSEKQPEITKINSWISVSCIGQKAVTDEWKPSSKYLGHQAVLGTRMNYCLEP